MRTAPTNEPLDERLDPEPPLDDPNQPSLFEPGADQPAFGPPSLDHPMVDLGTPTGPAMPPPAGPTATAPSRHRWRKFGLIGAIVALLAGGAVALVVLLTPKADFVAESLDTPEAIVAGETLDVAVHVRNRGGGDGERDITLLVNGAASETVAVQLDGKAETDVSFEVAGLAAGTHELGVEGWADLHSSVHVMTPAEFVIDEVAVTPTAVNVGEDLTVSVSYSNIGEADGSYDLRVMLGDRLIEERAVELEGSTSGETTFTITAEGRGYMAVSVNGEPRRIQVLAPAEFVIDGVDVSPNPANLTALEPVSVVVHLSNIGDVEGVHNVEFLIDNRVAESRGVTVAGGASTDQVFTFVPDHPGIHVVGVAGTTVDLDVYQLERPDNGSVLVNEIGGGSNRLTVKNQRSEDVLVVLTDPADHSRPLLSVYVHADSSTTVRGIRSGTYATFYVHGSDWCAFYRQFTTSPTYGRFQEDSVFTASGSSYTIITLTFGATDGGWSPTDKVSPDDFPR